MFISPMLASPTPEKKRPSVTSEKGYLLEPKHDGMRAIVSKHDGEVKIYSRVGLEYQEHLPALVSELQSVPDGTILDGELMVVKRWEVIEGFSVAVADFNSTMRIMGSGPEKAIARQETQTIKFCAFDILELGNKSLQGFDYTSRSKALQSAIANHEMPSVFKNASVEHWDDSFIDQMWAYGIEGAILKNKDSLYIEGKRRANTWYKVKEENSDLDFVVTGLYEGTGKYAGTLGGLSFGAYSDEGILVPVGRVGGGFSDKNRVDIWKKRNDVVGSVIMIKCNNFVGSGIYKTPRHPQFLSFRVDKKATDCHMDQVS